MADAADLPIGRRVLVRDRTIKGRNKIQDRWLSNSYRVIERNDQDGNVYTVEPLDGHGGLKTVNRTELLDTKAMSLLNRGVSEERYDGPVSDAETEEFSNSSDESEYEVGIRMNKNSSRKTTARQFKQ